MSILYTIPCCVTRQQRCFSHCRSYFQMADMLCQVQFSNLFLLILFFPDTPFNIMPSPLSHSLSSHGNFLSPSVLRCSQFKDLHFRSCSSYLHHHCYMCLILQEDRFNFLSCLQNKQSAFNRFLSFRVVIFESVLNPGPGRLSHNPFLFYTALTQNAKYLLTYLILP